VTSVAVMKPRLQQRGGESFVGPYGSSWAYGGKLEGSGGGLCAAAGQACVTWCVPTIASVRHSLMVVEEVLQVAMLLPSSGWMCYCRLLVPMARCALVDASGQLLSMAVEVVPSRVVVVLPPMYWIVSSQSGGPHSVYHGETTMVPSKPWRHMLVGGKLGGLPSLVRSCGFFWSLSSRQ
jgi:hypothetical protein